MTEFGPGIFSMGPEHAERKAGSIGKPNYFVDARVVDDHNAPVPAGEIGELCVKGPMRCSGYLGVPEMGVDAEGFFHTGDMARVDEEGFYYIADRKKDMFISGGENVYPIEIERALYEHPAVGQCAVIGVPDDRWGEVGKAVVIPKPGVAVGEEELIEHCRSRLARYKVPKSVAFVDALPLSAAGKILKRELREQFK
jgi:fatty-acyl-CoA synthase